MLAKRERPYNFWALASCRASGQAGARAEYQLSLPRLLTDLLPVSVALPDFRNRMNTAGLLSDCLRSPFFPQQPDGPVYFFFRIIVMDRKAQGPGDAVLAEVDRIITAQGS